MGGRGVLASVGATLALSVASFVPAGAIGGWSIVPSPNGVGAAAAQLEGIHCLTATSCVAVGQQLGGNAWTTLVERFDGARWAREVTPKVSGATSSTLHGVSCASATFCVAVGSWRGSNGYTSPILEMWNGASWSIAAIPSPSVYDVELRGVACVGVSDCTAVGWTYDPNGPGGSGLIEHWNGSSWSTRSLPNPPVADAVFLRSIACTSATRCRAVGTYEHAPGSSFVYAARWNGTSWASDNAPTPNGAVQPPFVESVSCSSATRCMLVGYDNGGSMFSERSNGSAWAVVGVTPAPGSVHEQLRGVTCVADDDCTAVGDQGPDLSTNTLLIEHYDGVSWSPESIPSRDFDILDGISCVSATSCTAVGYAGGGWGHVLVLARHGGDWSRDPHADPINSLLSQLDGVACASATNCVAVGLAYRGTGSKVLTEAWNGSVWKLQPSAVPSTPASELADVACASTTVCVAVGNARPDNSTAKPIAEISHGAAWVLQTLPVPGGGATFTTLGGVACPSPTMCLAVGGAAGSGASHPLVERWNGTMWSIETAATAPGGANASLSDVACIAISSCVAVGSYDTSTGAHALVERWNGTSWSIQSTPTAVLPSAGLASVTCTSAASCVAAGTQHSVSYDQQIALVERWNGTKWSIDATPSPANTTTVLRGIACVSGSDCVAVGYSHDPSIDPMSVSVGIIEHWDGASWTRQASPIPPGDHLSTLGGVACIAARCTAVGSSAPQMDFVSGPNTLAVRSA